MQQICVPPRIQRTSVRHRQNIFFCATCARGWSSVWRKSVVDDNVFHLGKYLPGYGLMIYEYVPRWLMNMVCISPYMQVIFHHLWFDDIWIIMVKNNCHNSVDYSGDYSPCSEFMNIYWIFIEYLLNIDLPHFKLKTCRTVLSSHITPGDIPQDPEHAEPRADATRRASLHPRLAQGELRGIWEVASHWRRWDYPAW